MYVQYFITVFMLTWALQIDDYYSSQLHCKLPMTYQLATAMEN